MDPNRHVAFLRGINIGKRRATKDDLIAPLATIGLTNVDTFLASGNVIFDAPVDATPANLEAQIHTALSDALGYDVAIFVRSAAQVHALVAAEPFTETELAEAASRNGKPQVTLLDTKPTKAAWTKVLAMETPDDLLRQGDRVWFWLPAEGMSLTKLKMADVEKLVGVGTTRTRNTLARIAKKFL